MRLSQVRIRMVERVACAIRLERCGFGKTGSSYPGAVGLIDVVTEKDDGVDVFSDHVLIRGVVTG